MPATFTSVAVEVDALETEVQRRRLHNSSGIPPVFAPLLADARYKGAWGGRGSAKSHTFAELLLKRCDMRPTRAVCVREHQVSLEQSVKRLLEDKIKEFKLNDRFTVYNNYIETPMDGLIIFQGMKNHTAQSIKSLEGYDVAWFEEAQSASEQSLTLLRPTIRNKDSELWFTWNPDLKTDPVDMMLRGDVTPPGAIVVHANYSDNPYFPDVLKLEMEWDRSRDPEKYAHIWCGDYQRHSEARVFKNWRIGSPEEFKANEATVFYYGADWGFSVDPSVLVRVYIVGRDLYIDYEAYKIGCEIDHIPTLFDRVPGAKQWQIRADSARPETISYLQRNGFPKLVPAIKGPDSVKEGVIFLQGYNIIVHPRCTHTVDELTMYRYRTDAVTGLVTPILEDKKNHVIDSLRYAVELIRKPKHWVTI
jgi:phage terminase large subunit